MRLKCIKLAGFKSFVDPTTINFPSSMCAVVGPNGCGKSNVIDAVRWVMGESSARNLRGESITDVIFSGTDARKPVGQASVELIFDNHDHALTGEYAKFNEVSIKRRVERDGQSTYLLNGSKVRRKDITDIFLGTGLGARSYSIIEQGMVSRLIESKPEELRVFIEEAAGISRYKERRRDTENRIKRTRENLERLTDIREELARQLQNLKRQSIAAEKYGELKQEQRQCQANLNSLRWQCMDSEIKEVQGTISQLEIQLEAITAEQRTIDANMEKHLSDNADLTDAHGEVQARYYSIGNDIARLEQSIKHHIERAEQLKLDLSETEEMWEQNREGLDVDLRKVTELATELSELQPLWEQARNDAEASAVALAATESDSQALQKEWDEFNKRAEEPRQNAEVEQSRIQQLEIIVERGLVRKRRLETEQQELDGLPTEPELDSFNASIAEQESKLNVLRELASDQQIALEADRKEIVRCQKELDTAISSLQAAKNKHSSLEALQLAALGQDNPALNDWLQNHGLGERARLAEAINIEPGWELAVESVLGDNLQAISVNDMDVVAELLPSLPSGKLAFMEPPGQIVNSQSHGPLPTLASKVQSECNLDEFLGGIYALESLEEAQERRSKLAVGESIITPQGVWLGKNWIQISNISKQKSIVERQSQLSELNEQITNLQQETCRDLQKARDTVRDRLEETQLKRDSTQQALTDATEQLGELKSRHSAYRAKTEETKMRRMRVSSEIEELNRQLATEQQNLTEARSRLQTAVDCMAEDLGGREQLEARRHEATNALRISRENSRHSNERAHQLALQHQALESQLKSTRLTMDRMAIQVQRSKERMESLKVQIEGSDEPLQIMRKELQQHLELRLEVQKELDIAKAKVDENEHKMRTLERNRSEKQQQLNTVNQSIMQSRLTSEGAMVKRQALVEQLQDAGFELEKVLAQLPLELTEPECEQQLEKLNNRINRLGPINLAAIDEYKKQSERKLYLDQQNEDLETALNTLQKAIRKIDRETRTRFKETFEKINEGLKGLFPRIFGGGHAYLDMTGEDLLDTGVAIMARPPGKRNSTIQLLSGGEKAMTAIALVFSIFRLNPSPFCMLDEVDAPLDDDNAVRYIKLVKEISASVQFIFVTHNKITMEMANQLLGVTMHEPGVSRIVAVDIDEAVEMVAA